MLVYQRVCLALFSCILGCFPEKHPARLDLDFLMDLDLRSTLFRAKSGQEKPSKFQMFKNHLRTRVQGKNILGIRRTLESLLIHVHLLVYIYVHLLVSIYI